MQWKLLTLASILIALLGVALYSKLQAVDPSYVPQGTQNTGFDEVAPDLYRLGRTWTVLQKILEIHISVFLIRSGKDYILVDAGVPNTNYTDLLVEGVRAATKNGNLRMILRKCLFFPFHHFYL